MRLVRKAETGLKPGMREDKTLVFPIIEAIMNDE